MPNYYLSSKAFDAQHMDRFIVKANGYSNGANDHFNYTGGADLAALQTSTATNGALNQEPDVEDGEVVVVDEAFEQKKVKSSSLKQPTSAIKVANAVDESACQEVKRLVGQMETS